MMKNVVTMTSRELAELCGKRHDHVLRDIDQLLENVKDLTPHFRVAKYTNSRGKRYRQFECTKNGSLMLVAGYNANVRWKLIQDWDELERVAAAMATAAQAVRVAQDMEATAHEALVVSSMVIGG